MIQVEEAFSFGQSWKMPFSFPAFLRQQRAWSSLRLLYNERTNEQNKRIWIYFCVAPFESCVPNTFYFWMSKQRAFCESREFTFNRGASPCVYVLIPQQTIAQRASQRISEGDFRLQKPRVPGSTMLFNEGIVLPEKRQVKIRFLT